jgi:hypothetical protein
VRTEIAVYNLEVERGHTYFVGNNHPVLVHNVCQTPDQQALKDIVKEASNNGTKPLSVEDANTVNRWAQETNYPGFRASPNDLASPSNWPGGGYQPHIHLPGTGRHAIPVAPGVTPVTP